MPRPSRQAIYERLDRAVDFLDEMGGLPSIDEMRDIWQDVRHGARSLVREPLFSLAVIATLALGIGVNTAMFGVADRLLLRGPEHVRDSARVRRMQSVVQRPGMDVQRGGTFGYVTYDALRTQAHSF